jgi:transposase
MKMRCHRYSTDLTNREWQLLEPLIPPPKEGGRPRTVPMREIVNGLFYVLRGGIPWRMMPHDLPKWQTVSHDVREWRKTGLWERMNAALREQCRVRVGREATPSAGILDSQSVKTTEKGVLAAMTAERRSAVENATSSSIRKVC